MPPTHDPPPTHDTCNTPTRIPSIRDLQLLGGCNGLHRSRPMMVCGNAANSPVHWSNICRLLKMCKHWTILNRIVKHHHTALHRRPVWNYETTDKSRASSSFISVKIPKRGNACHLNRIPWLVDGDGQDVIHGIFDAIECNGQSCATSTISWWQMFDIQFKTDYR